MSRKVTHNKSRRRRKLGSKKRKMAAAVNRKN